MLYNKIFSIKRLWIILAISVLFSFSVLGFFGSKVYKMAPPIPQLVQDNYGKTIYTGEQITRGQNIWQSLGGMQQGSIWGHGSYLAPDWSADWLHREAESLYAVLLITQKKEVYSRDNLKIIAREKVKQIMRTNTYDEKTQAITINQDRKAAINNVKKHYKELFIGGSAKQELREKYAFPAKQTLSEDKAEDLTAFFFWTAWSTATNRPNDNISYTSNWPHEPLVGNVPAPSVLIWSLVSIILLLAGIAALIWFYVKQFDHWRKDSEPEKGFAKEDILSKGEILPSMRSTAKYFWLVGAMFFVQIILGIITAHYQVEGQSFYGIPLSDYLPYSILRTWHTQLAVLWIATAWLATGLYIAPLLSGYEPKYQKLGVNFLFVSLIIIVLGSFIGQWLAIQGFFDDLGKNFWFGHQGYEYVDLGRFWQIYLFIGLILWLVLVLRALKPLLLQKNKSSLLFLVIISTTAIGLLYGAGLMWGQETHISIVEYWRWWVVHLWVEGVFEVFATAIISMILVRMQLLRYSVATTMVLFATIIFLFGGVLGTFHHLYWSGTPISVLSLGAVFSALEVVPLMLVGFEAYSRSKIEHQRIWEENYHWPFMFFAAVLFWNMVGAGLFGFLINPPIALYYMQGLATTANHGHAALMGVYGMLGIGLVLFCLRNLTDIKKWNNKLLKISFWSLNIGLFLMTFLSLLPQGLIQTYYSIKYSYYSARSAELIHSPVMEFLVWLRVPGDIVFSIGVVTFVMFMYKAFKKV